MYKEVDGTAFLEVPTFGYKIGNGPVGGTEEYQR